MEEMKIRPEDSGTDYPARAEDTDSQATNGALAEQTQGSEDAPPNTHPPVPPMDWKRFGVPVFVLMVLTVGLVLAIQFMPRPQPLQDGKTLNKIPATLGEWTLLTEYPMSESALKELKPDEYVARIYVNPSGDQADLSIIAGSHTGAFHNPQVCFRVQNWSFEETSEIKLQVPGKEEPISATFVRLVSSEGQSRKAVGIYFYSTPMGYRTDTSSARIFLLLARLTGMDQQRAYFVRFLKTSQGDPERDREEIKQFAEQALAAIAQTNPEVVR
ncbi:MAG: EpsI family protein [Armatimonadetes bacterium JP3_11]|jgi:EpsI family protein|nr:MAG: EpsI family protein [Armatimonadetes bacterium CP1_7O]OYT75620.1 MAG: EpsI family protein [Armatimonadetes bacterium JP3_11]RMH08004.1 MAG: EpsI family protein [Armatimonadota bacterium]